MYSDVPNSVKIARGLVRAVALVPLSGLLIWIYTHELKPYEVRYYTQTVSKSPTEFRVFIYSDTDAIDSAKVSLDCGPDNLIDVGFRPVLEDARDWSLREMFSSIPETKTFLAGKNSYLIDEIADRYAFGGLSEWDGLKSLQLRNSLDSLLTRSRDKLTRSERTNVEAQFFDGKTARSTNQIIWPVRLSQARQADLRNSIDRMQLAWQTSVALIDSNWLQRWQTLTGVPLAVRTEGLGATTPLYLSIPALKQGAGVVLRVDRESSAVPQGIQVVVGDTVAYQVRSFDCLKSSSILLLAEDKWRLILALLAFSALCGVVYYSYWRWPKHLKTPQLFQEAQLRKSDELWAELRARAGWVDSYVVSQFFVARTIMVPNADVISYFWRCVRDALCTHPVPASTDDEVRQTILEILDRSIQNALI
jgi:hypothetical protein